MLKSVKVEDVIASAQDREFKSRFEQTKYWTKELEPALRAGIKPGEAYFVMFTEKNAADWKIKNVVTIFRFLTEYVSEHFGEKYKVISRTQNGVPFVYIMNSKDASPKAKRTK